MNLDSSLTSDPMFVLLAWAAGVSLAAAAVTLRGTVGAGFTWLASATAVLIGVWPASGGWLPAVGVGGVALGGLIVKHHRRVSALLLGLGGLSLLAVAVPGGGVVGAVTATVALGGITGEMLLGHWYLVDPTLPRTILRILALGGIAGVAADAIVSSFSVPTGFQLLVFWSLAVTTAGLMAAVVGALRYPAYSGVMAATGLSYLAVLTGLAVVFLGRALADGGLMAT